MNVIDITSPKELPKNREFYLFNDENDVALVDGLHVTVYRLTRKIKKEYTEWYVMKDDKK